MILVALKGTFELIGLDLEKKLCSLGLAESQFDESKQLDMNVEWLAMYGFLDESFWFHAEQHVVIFKYESPTRFCKNMELFQNMM